MGGAANKTNLSGLPLTLVGRVVDLREMFPYPLADYARLAACKVNGVSGQDRYVFSI